MAWLSATLSAVAWRTGPWFVRCTSRWAPGQWRSPTVFASHNPYTAMVVLFCIGATGAAVAPALQTRLMDVAHNAQTLAAALNHSALNIGNATGAWVGGLVIAAGYGYTAPAAAGGVLAVAGLLVLTVLFVAGNAGPEPKKPLLPSVDEVLGCLERFLRCRENYAFEKVQISLL